MGVTSSKNAVYPLPIPGHTGYGPPQSSWSVFGKGKKGKERMSGPSYYVPNPYSYMPQPYPYYPAQTFSSSYYPQAGVAQMGMPQPAVQPVMQMPVPNGTSDTQQGQVYDPAAIPPPPVPMPEPPQTEPVIPPPPQVHSQPQPQAGRFPESQVTFLPLSQSYPSGQPNPSVFGPPGPRPRTPIRNPLPTPPRDLYELSPYGRLLHDMHTTTSLLTGQGAFLSDSRPNNHGGGLGNLFGSKSSREKKSRKGLFRSSSNTNGNGIPPSMSGMFGGPLQRSHTVTSFVTHPPVPQPPNLPQSNGATAGSSMPTSTSAPAGPADPSRPPPVRFDHQSPLAGFMNHSPHRILYQNTLYPSALHLLEAIKFHPHRPDLSEQIRAVKDVQDVYPLSASMNEFVRGDWGQVFSQTVEEVLYLKFKQHPDLRSLLMNTGLADIIYSDLGDSYWGEGPTGQGANELGRAIMRVRERLRREGYSVGPPVNSGATTR